MDEKKLFMIGGASGTGKTAICNQIAGKIEGLNRCWLTTTQR